MSSSSTRRNFRTRGPSKPTRVGRGRAPSVKLVSSESVEQRGCRGPTATVGTGRALTESRKRLALWQLGLLTLAYFAAGKLGLSLAVVNASVSPVWPPTGIAFASFLVLGPRVWPAILIGAFLVNVTTTGSIAPSLGIAIGNTCEGRLGAELVRLFANGRNVFSRARDVFKFVVLAGLFSTAVSATIGVSSLALAGHAAWRDYPAIWFTWWLGDAVGALVVGPAVVLWSARGDDSRSRARRLGDRPVRDGGSGRGSGVLRRGRAAAHVSLPATPGLDGVPLRPSRDGGCDRDPVRPGDLGHDPRPGSLRRRSAERGLAATAGLPRHDGGDQHHDCRGRGGAKARRGGPGTSGLDRGILRRRHREWHARGRRHELERGCRAPLRLLGRGGGRPADLDHHSARSPQRAAPRPGAAQAWRARAALRDRAPAKGRHARTGVGRDLAAAQPIRRRHRRLRDQP